MIHAQMSPSSPLSQPSSSASSESDYMNYLGQDKVESNKNQNEKPTVYKSKSDSHKTKNGTNQNKQNVKNGNKMLHKISSDEDDDDDEEKEQYDAYNKYDDEIFNVNVNDHYDENIANNAKKELGRHPCTPRPETYDKIIQQQQHGNNIKNKNKLKKNKQHKRHKRNVNTRKSNQFSNKTLKPITTPRPQSVGAESTDNEDDDDTDSEDNELPQDDDIYGTDDYILKKKRKWTEHAKNSSYHAYTTQKDDDDEEEKSSMMDDEKKLQNDDDHKNGNNNTAKNDKNGNNKKRKPRRGQDYFPSDELDGRYEFIRYLGHGAYGYVAEGRHTETGKKVAIKKILKIFHNRIDAKRLLRELRICRILAGHDNIVQLVDILPPKNFETFDQIILVFEFIDTDLSKLIQSDQYFTKLHVQYMLYQVLIGLKFMHSLKIFHRDLKPANILVNEDVSLKICDFGLARCTWNDNTSNIFKQNNNNKYSSSTKSSSVNNNNNQQQKPAVSRPTSATFSRSSSNGHNNNYKHKQLKGLTQHVVTRWYRAPEVILLEQRRKYLGAVDMWSVGCIFGELLQMLRENLRSYVHRKPIFPGQSSIPLSPPSDPFPSMDQLTVIFGIIGTPTPEEILNINNERAARFLEQIQKCPPSQLKNMYPGADEQALSLLRGLLQFDVEKRITVDEALSHPFIKEVRDESNEKKYDKLLQKIQFENSLNFEFEDIKMKMDTYRSLIIEEVLRYNRHLLTSKSSHSSTFDFV